MHFSELHLAANLAGCVLVAALGLTARVPTRCVVAWALAWPALHLGLWVQPALTHYGGLSGVLHAGVAVVGERQCAAARKRTQAARARNPGRERREER